MYPRYNCAENIFSLRENCTKLYMVVNVIDAYILLK